MRIKCKLPSCDKFAIPGRQFCSATHTGQYCASHKKSKSNYPKIPKAIEPVKPKLTKSIKPRMNSTLEKFIPPPFILDEIIGPLLPRKAKNALKKNQQLDRRKFLPRQELLKLATPSWANKTKIDEIYKERDHLNQSGILHHVDHIIPLNHPLVCGLHVESNLQVLLKEDNEFKNNTFHIE